MSKHPPFVHEETPALKAVLQKYSFAITPLMQEHLSSPAIAAQFLPQEAELLETENELSDPIGDDAHSPLKGLVHRYPDRVLLKLTSLCPVYCRFCFRREYVGPQGYSALTQQELDAIYAYIAADPRIFEVIFTGGDPLILSARRLEQIIKQLAQISHLKVIRFHTRVPLVAPEKITPHLLKSLRSKTQQTYIVIHTNHKDEWQTQGITAVAQLREAGFPLLAQTVLLKGINNNVAVLKELFQTLIHHGVTPYLLHHPDRARGTGHFRLSIAEGQELLRHLRGQISGYALPQYILDIPGGYGKIPLTPSYLETTQEGIFVHDLHGNRHFYER